jgi:multiple sugar transport system substrate-binding protein
MSSRLIRFVLALTLVGALSLVGAGAQDASKGFAAPPGKMVMWAFGQPKYWQLQIDDYFKANPSEVQGVTAEVVATKGEEEVRQKTMLALASQTWDDMADVVSTFPVSMQAMAEAGVLLDLTSYLEPFKDKFVAGTYDQLSYKGRLWALPRSLRPQLLFYNKEIFDKYNIDPKQMSTFEGYLEVGRKLKSLSKGQVFLSYEDPGSRTWRYWGRRGLMPQAGARIWDDDGNVVIDKDPGSLKAFQYFDTLHKEGLLYNSIILQPPLYQAMREGKVATFYIGAFYDEFLKANDQDMAGKWRVMAAPVFSGLNLGGAPVVDIVGIIAKPKAPYAELYKRIWYDYNFDSPARQAYTLEVLKLNGPVQNPLSKAMLDEPFWKEADPYYGGQSFKQMEGLGLRNVSKNLRVTTADAEADTIISAELEKYIANAQTMDEAIKNMGIVLRDKIGKAPANLDK